MNTNLFHNQDAIMENIMLFSPMPVLQAIQDSFTESMLADELDCEESVPVQNIRKCDRKERARRHRKANRTHKIRDRYHGKAGKEYKYAGDYADRNYRLYYVGNREYVDPIEMSARPINIHKDVVPVPEQEPWYVGDYETREVCEGVTVTMEWPTPEAVYGDGTEPEPMSSKEANDYTLYCLKMAKYWVHKSEQVQGARYDGKLADVLREELQNGMVDFYEHALI